MVHSERSVVKMCNYASDGGKMVGEGVEVVEEYSHIFLEVAQQRR